MAGRETLATGDMVGLHYLNPGEITMLHVENYVGWPRGRHEHVLAVICSIHTDICQQIFKIISPITD